VCVFVSIVGCLFERVLTQLMPTIAEPSENDENFELLFATLDKYLHILDINDKVRELKFISCPSSIWNNKNNVNNACVVGGMRTCR
jgi:hypothetical protein